ncbi:MAG: hypothetical protein ABI411_00465 [Tahibacter sp.]
MTSFSVSAVQTASRLPVRNWLRSAVWAGLLSGSLDLIYNFVFWGLSAGVVPTRILQAIGTGLFGRESYALGGTSALAGGLAHYFILTVASFLYIAASARSERLARHWIAGGMLFGVAIFFSMKYVIVPLSAATPFQPMSTVMLFVNITVHLLLVGLPIAWVTHYRASRQT